jgi:predicted O-methyltransferase YrrM
MRETLIQAVMIMSRPILAAQLRRLRSTADGAKMAEGLVDGILDDPVVSAIETIRSRMLADHGRLADGRLGEPSPWDEVTVSKACSVSRNPRAARYLYRLVQSFRPKTIVELGTNVGVSSAYMGAAQRRGTLVTLDASPYRIEKARALHAECTLQTIECVVGRFAETLGPTLDRLPSVDMAFIDGHHQYQPTLDYFETLRRKASDGALFVFDDINWSDGMRQAWASISSQPCFSIVVSMRNMGFAVIRKHWPAKPVHVSLAPFR